MRFAVFLLFVAGLPGIALTGCGSKGPLVLPPKEAQAPSRPDGNKAPTTRPTTDEVIEPASEPVVQ